MAGELIDIVDDKNNVRGKWLRTVAHERGLLHRAVNVFVFNTRGDVFLQKRGKKSVCPLVWDVSASEHVKAGEQYHEAALRGMREELGLQVKIKKIRNVHLQKSVFGGRRGKKIKDFEFVTTYSCVYDGSITVNKHEAIAGHFFTVADIRAMVRKNRNQFTPWFLEEWAYLEGRGRPDARGRLRSHGQPPKS